MAALVVAVGLSTAAPPAVARGADRSRALELGARLGYGLPLGNVVGPADAVSDTISSMWTIGLDAGYRATLHWYFGASFMYGAGARGNALTQYSKLASAGDLSVHDTRVDIDVHYHLLPGRTLDPWLGAGLGFEWLGIDALGVAGSGLSVSGWEFFNGQAGVDVGLGHLAGVGPFVALSLAEFDTISSGSTGTSIGHRSLHEWFVVGVRVAFDAPLVQVPMGSPGEVAPAGAK